MKKILVPTDFSKPAQIAVDVAADIAKKSNAELVLLHVVEEATGDSLTIDGEVSTGTDWEDRIFTMRLIERGKKQLAKMVEDAKLTGVKVRQELRLGTPFHGMRTIITDQKVDLVVMGTAGKTKLEEMIIGSNTEKVVRHANCPVLTVHKKPAKSDFKNIVYATSMSKDEEVFSRIVRRTQQLYDATVHLVRINTPGNFQRDTVVKKYMQDFAKKLQLKNFTINVFNDLTEEEGIVYFADSINADMIAMATHGRTGFAHVLAGSIAEDVVSHSKRPVLTFVTKQRK
ncbi:universal stress protein [Fulvivirgaceae bacterium PWU4]|uniref:Universal stress protein n=1 Tax=Chryseosolibacter histidini TaxID=2782349 RepID=A0AAP2DMG7_9BACT|nr:universal stress protein [Chryseosolibacter histidini]MBT1699076.1 universal stress protein [Chryseosolibacter histidini]